MKATLKLNETEIKTFFIQSIKNILFGNNLTTIISFDEEIYIPPLSSAITYSLEYREDDNTVIHTFPKVKFKYSHIQKPQSPYIKATQLAFEVIQEKV